MVDASSVATTPEATTRYYIRKVDAFARHFQCPADRLGPQYMLHAVLE